MEEFHISGLVAATFTPLKANGDIDYDKIDDYCQFLSNEGISQVYVNGSTGEGPSLTTEERMKTTECWVKAGRKNSRMSKILVQVGGTTLRDSIALARHAESEGVAAISSLPPIYFPISTMGDLVEYCRQVAAAAPSTPFYYYHIPAMTRVNLDMATFLETARDVIPTLRGVKYSHQDLVQMCHCLRSRDRHGRAFNILYGCDEQLMAAVVLGADGAIGSTYNHMAGTFHRLLALLSQSDLPGALAEQHRSQDFVQQLYRYGAKTGGSLPTGKAVMSFVGCDVGPVRPPLRSLQPDERSEFYERLKSIGFFEWRK
ncbi:N-acetylneuraminate lyase-like [Pomacea canaliculata]|uniref:N-acetylneuraminate lyase-like n=1 Tax=Pomacea canaliculata TaxID=400727 RepID=UPI000D729FE7|nr:N-acetylneuraminate lyase-like [Pomacea canaliculata]XP_025091744.1 N-acetylneuraminate lyase-like [Pomacea canaliculata]XP_025091745.1 N-acetylneuraminate lyase-like [Pomacea canaliculata]